MTLAGVYFAIAIIVGGAGFNWLTGKSEPFNFCFEKQKCDFPETSKIVYVPKIKYLIKTEENFFGFL